jgi:hypothetical protein
MALLCRPDGIGGDVQTQAGGYGFASSRELLHRSQGPHRRRDFGAFDWVPPRPSANTSTANGVSGDQRRVAHIERKLAKVEQDRRKARHGGQLIKLPYAPSLLAASLIAWRVNGSVETGPKARSHCPFVERGIYGIQNI